MMNSIKLPIVPELTELEIELTNICNATCVTCPRSAITAPKGYMEAAVFEKIIDSYTSYRDQLRINQLQHKSRFPFITLAGMGDPLLHKGAYDFIRLASDRDFPVSVITNGTMLNEHNAMKLADSGVKNVYISVWGVNEEEYKAAMGLGNFDRILKNVEYFAVLARKKEIEFKVVWVKTKYIQSSMQEIRSFWGERGITIDIEDTTPWNRGGYVDSEYIDPPSLKHVDFQKKIWCGQLYFTDTVTWSGDFILCCNDYFEKTTLLGNIYTDSLQEIAARKLEILQHKRCPSICGKCTKPSHNYLYGSWPWDSLLPPSEKSKYTYK